MLAIMRILIPKDYGGNLSRARARAHAKGSVTTKSGESSGESTGRWRSARVTMGACYQVVDEMRTNRSEASVIYMSMSPTDSDELLDVIYSFPARSER